MDPYQLKKLNAERRARRAAIYLTDLGDGRDRVICEGDPVAGDLEQAVAAAFRSGVSAAVEAEGTTFFLNTHLPPPRIVVIGAVHISQALAAIAKIAGFDILIIDPRTAFATQDRFAATELVADWPEDVLKSRPLDAYTALVAVSHDPKIDDLPIMTALQVNCFYVGALGSRKTHAKRVERMAAAGVSETSIARIAAPIGLDIGAANPAEIAVAIMAEIVRAFRKRDVSAAADATGAVSG